MTAAHYNNGRRDGIRDAERDNSCRCNSIEGTRRAEENAAKHDNPRNGPEKCVERDFESRMDTGKEAAKRHTAVACKGVAHASAGAGKGCGGEDHAQYREDEQTGATSFVLRSIHEDL